MKSKKHQYKSFMKIGIIAKRRIFEHSEQAQKLCSLLNEMLKNDVYVLLEEALESLWQHTSTANIFKELPQKQLAFMPPNQIFEEVEIVIVLGGDGTLLRAASYLRARRIPILAVNCGNVGFMSEVLFEELSSVLPRIFHKQYVTEQRTLLQIEFTEKNKSFAAVALNEVVVHHGKFARLIELLIQIDDRDFLKSKADGWIIATPTGSTAHSLSAGGSVVDVALNAIVMTPMNPANLSLRPFVIADHHSIRITLLSKCKGENYPYVTIDGQQAFAFSENASLTIQKSSRVCELIRFTETQSLHHLPSKLGW